MQMFLVLNRYRETNAQFKAVMSLTWTLDSSLWMHERPDVDAMFRSDYGLTDKNFNQWIAHRNPVANFQNIARDLPIIIVQGGEDERVGMNQGKAMAMKLIEHGFHSVRYRAFPKTNHMLSNFLCPMKAIWRLFGEER